VLLTWLPCVMHQEDFHRAPHSCRRQAFQLDETQHTYFRKT
jgi:hypothetical protein